MGPMSAREFRDHANADRPPVGPEATNGIVDAIAAVRRLHPSLGVGRILHLAVIDRPLYAMTDDEITQAIYRWLGEDAEGS